MAEDDTLLDSMITAACKAGLNSLDVLEGTFRVERKSDRSPVTRADTEADAIISRTLAACGLPIVSEESPLPDHEQRMSWPRYFLVDPLDGTKGFVRGGQEFAVNIALMHEQTPVLGVIALPISGTLYFGGPEVATCHVDEGFETVLMHPHSIFFRAHPAGHDATETRESGQPERSDRLRVIASRHSLDEATGNWIAGLKTQLAGNTNSSPPFIETVQAGSAAKFCALAESEADVYPRFAPCMEWDTAAGVALLRGAGGEVYDAGTGAPLAYGDPDWYSRPFIAVSRAGFAKGMGVGGIAEER